MIPRICPTCQSESIEQMMRDISLSAYRDSLKCGSSRVIAYHCDSGHVFLMINEGFRWEEAAPEANSVLTFV
jgi:hypothetical protein